MQLQTYKLSEIAEVNPSKFKGTLANDEVGFIPMSYVDDVSGEVVKIDTVNYKKVSKGYTSFIDSDVVFAKITPCMENGKCAVIRNLPNGAGFGSTEFYVIRPKQNIFSDYIWHYLRQEKVRKSAVKHFTGSSGHKRVPKDFIEGLDIPFPLKNNEPDLSEQKRVASKLTVLFSEIDKAIEKTKEALDKANEIFDSEIESLIQKTKNESWKLIKVEEVIDVKIGGTPRRGVSKYWTEGNNPWVSVGELNDNIITDTEEKITDIGVKESNVKLVQTGTVLMSFKLSVGKVAFSGIDLYTNEAIAALVPKSELLISDYIYFVVPYFAKRGAVKGSMGQGNLNSQKIKSMPIPIPFKGEVIDKKAQETVTERLKNIKLKSNKLSSKFVEQIRSYERLKQSLLNQAFEGKL